MFKTLEHWKLIKNYKIKNYKILIIILAFPQSFYLTGDTEQQIYNLTILKE